MIKSSQTRSGKQFANFANKFLEMTLLENPKEWQIVIKYFLEQTDHAYGTG